MPLQTEDGSQLKGSSSRRPITDIPSFTLDFKDKHHAQRFHGLRKIHLNKPHLDPTALNEQFTGELFRAAGVPAARTTHASVILNGKNLGLYVLKKGFEPEMFGQHFSRTEGKVYDGTASDFEDMVLFHAIKEGWATEMKRLRLALKADASHRWEAIRQNLYTEKFASMMAVERLINHSDGYSANGNNYKVFINAEDKRVVFCAHGLDQATFAPDFKYVGATLSPNAHADVGTAFLSHPEGRALYEKRLREIFANQFQLGPMTNRVIELSKPVRAEIERVEGREAADLYDGHVDGLIQRIANRWHEVDRHLKL